MPCIMYEGEYYFIVMGSRHIDGQKAVASYSVEVGQGRLLTVTRDRGKPVLSVGALPLGLSYPGPLQ